LGNVNLRMGRILPPRGKTIMRSGAQVIGSAFP
jgi:hypothetical protein